MQLLVVPYSLAELCKLIFIYRSLLKTRICLHQKRLIKDIKEIRTLNKKIIIICR